MNEQFSVNIGGVFKAESFNFVVRGGLSSIALGRGINHPILVPVTSLQW